MTPRELVLAALPPAPAGVVVAELPRLTGLDAGGVALAVAGLWGDGRVRCWSWCNASFVAREQTEHGSR